jgi:hypothetical protein
MNIFVLDTNPKICAQYHVDKHVVKMILELAQILSTAHRVLDGIESVSIQNGRKHKSWELPDCREDILYKSTHMNHPSTIWARENSANYKWTLNLLDELCIEYSYRYERIHKVEFAGLLGTLQRIPDNIEIANVRSPFALAMPDEYRFDDAVESYRAYYNDSKREMFSWKNRPTPEWISI